METSTKLWVIGIGVLVIVVAASIVIKKIRKNQRRSLPEPAGYLPIDEEASERARRRVAAHDDRPRRHEPERSADGRRLPRRHADEDDTCTPPHGFQLPEVEPGYRQEEYTYPRRGFGYHEIDHQPVEPVGTGFNTDYTRYTGDGGYRLPDVGDTSGTVNGGYSVPQQSAAPEQGGGSPGGSQPTD